VTQPEPTSDTTTAASLADRAKFHAQALLTLLADAKLRPLADRVLITPLEANYTQKQGSLYVVKDEAKDLAHAWRGLVVAVGPGSKDSPGLDVAEGDVVLMGRFVGEALDYRGVECRLVRFADILATTDL